MLHKDIAKIMNVHPQTVNYVIWKAGGKSKVLEEYAPDPKFDIDGESNQVAMVDETDILRAGMRVANDKLTRVFIRLATQMNEEVVMEANLDKQFKYLQILAPILKNQVRDMKPSNVNFFIGNGNAEDLERRML